MNNLFETLQTCFKLGLSLFKMNATWCDVLLSNAMPIRQFQVWLKCLNTYLIETDKESQPISKFISCSHELNLL